MGINLETDTYRVLHTDPGGQFARLVGEWQPGDRAALEASGVRALWLHMTEDLSFLGTIPDLVSELYIIGPGRVDTSVIVRLHDLEALAISDRRQSLGNLGQLRKLRSFAGRWDRTAATLASCPDLRDLSLRGGVKSLDELSGFRTVEHLTLSSRALLSLRAERSLTEVRSLAVASRRLSLEGIGQSLPNLERLVIDGRLTSDLMPLTELRNLRILMIDNGGEIPTLAPLRSIPSLEEVALIESTAVADGDLSPLLDLPNLRDVGISAIRAYTPSIDEVEGAVSGEVVERTATSGLDLPTIGTLDEPPGLHWETSTTEGDLPIGPEATAKAREFARQIRRGRAPMVWVDRSGLRFTVIAMSREVALCTLETGMDNYVLAGEQLGAYWNAPPSLAARLLVEFVETGVLDPALWWWR